MLVVNVPHCIRGPCDCDQRPIVQTMSRLLRLATVAELLPVPNPPGKLPTTLRELLPSPHHTNKIRDHE